MRRLAPKVPFERIGNRLLGRFVPRLDAHAACCGRCCGTGIYRCTSHGAEQLYSCYAESFEGCYVYRQYWAAASMC